MGAISHTKGTLIWAYKGKEYHSYNSAYKAFTRDNDSSSDSQEDNNLTSHDSPVDNNLASRDRYMDKNHNENHNGQVIFGIAMLILSILLIVYWLWPSIQRYLSSNHKT